MIRRRDFIKIGGTVALAAAGVTKPLTSERLPLTGSNEVKIQQLLKNVIPFGQQDYDRRLQKAHQLMSENQMAAFFSEPGPTMQYFTGVNWWRSERTFGFLLFPGKNPVWICSAFELDRARELIPAVEEIRTWEENDNPFALIGKTISDYGQKTRLGLEPSTRAFIIYGLAKEVAGLELTDGGCISDGCRAVKSEKEIACLEAANVITKLAYKEAFGKIKSGMTEQELSGYIREAHIRFGVTGSGGPSFGPASSYPHGSRKKKNLQAGDVILVDGGCRVEGYSSDVTRSLVFGQASDKQKKVWDIIRKAQIAGLQACRPGVSCEEVDRAARKIIEDAGFGPGYKYFSHRLGHGVGLEGHEYPYLVQGNKMKIQPGMTFSNEPGIYLTGEFGIRIEDCMVVTEDGARIMGGLEAVSLEEPFGQE